MFTKMLETGTLFTQHTVCALLSSSSLPESSSYAHVSIHTVLLYWYEYTHFIGEETVGQSYITNPRSHSPDFQTMDLIEWLPKCIVCPYSLWAFHHGCDILVYLCPEPVNPMMEYSSGIKYFRLLEELSIYRKDTYNQK